MTLDDLHLHLRAHGLAMSNMGSISDQTIAGVTTVATHGTGIRFQVVPGQVISMTLLLADGSKVTCSRTERKDLFLASLCGFGSTGFVLNTKLKVEREFFLEEVQETTTFSDALLNLEDKVKAAEHLRLWWFPTEDKIVYDAFKRVYSVGRESVLQLFRSFTEKLLKPPNSGVHGPNKVTELKGLFSDHAIQLLLFFGLYFSRLVAWAGALAIRSWFPLGRSVKTDLSYRIFNLDCKVSSFPSAKSMSS